MVEQLNRVGYTSCFALSLFNIVKLCLESRADIFWVTNIIPFAAIGIFLVFNRWKTPLIIIFLLLSAIMTFLNGFGDVGGVVYMCFAVQLIVNPDLKIIIYIITLCEVLVKGILIDMDISTVITLGVGYIITAVIFFTILDKKKVKLQVVRKIEDVEVMEKLMRGKLPKEIAYELRISHNQVNKQLQRMRKEYKAKTTYQLISLYKDNLKLKLYSASESQ